MPAALEHYSALKTTQQGTTETSTWVTYHTLTMDRSGEAGAKNFFILAYIAVDGTNSGLGRGGKWRLIYDPGGAAEEVLAETGDKNVHEGHFGFAARRVSVTNASKNVELQFLAENASFTFNAEIGSIVAIEESANAEYAELSSETGTTTNTTWTDLHTLTFTPGTEQNYVLIFAAEVKAEDENGSGVEGIRFRNNTDSNVYAQEGISELAGGNDIYWSIGFTAYESLETSSHTLAIQGKGGGSTTEVKIKRACIIAIPVGDFESSQLDSSSTKTFHSTTFTDTNASITFTTAEKDYLILGAAEHSAESQGDNSYLRLDADGTIIGSTWGDDTRDEDVPEYWLNCIPHIKSVTAASRTFKLQASSNSVGSARETAVNNVYLVVLEIPEDTGTTISPSPVTVPLVLPQPTVTHQLNPDSVTAPIATPLPTVTHTLKPDAVAVNINVPALGTVTHQLNPDAVEVPLLLPTPTVSKSAEQLNPDPVTIPLVIAAPALGHQITPDAVSVVLALPTPGIAHTLNPDPAAIPLAIPVPSVQVDIQIDPLPVVITITPAVPSATVGGSLYVPSQFVKMIGRWVQRFFPSVPSDWWRSIP